MNRAYYYFVASLPSLSFESEPPISIDDFLMDSRRLLHPRDYQLLEALLIKDENDKLSGNEVYDRCVQFDNDLRNELAYARAKNAGKDPADYIRGERNVREDFSGIISAALKEENLLEAEKTLDQYRWKFLDSLEMDQPFTFGFIVIYALKLKILSRYERIDSSKGLEIFDELCLNVGKRLGDITGADHDIAETIKSEAAPD